MVDSSEIWASTRISMPIQVKRAAPIVRLTVPGEEFHPLI